MVSLRQQVLSSKALKPSTVSFNSQVDASGRDWSSSVPILETMKAEDTAPETWLAKSKFHTGRSAEQMLLCTCLSVIRRPSMYDQNQDRLSCNSALSTCSSDEAWQMALSIAGQSHRHEPLDVIGMNSAPRPCRHRTLCHNGHLDSIRINRKGGGLNLALRLLVPASGTGRRC